MNPKDKKRADEIVEELLKLDEYSENYYPELDKLEKKFYEIKGIKNYIHNRPRDVPDEFVFDYTVFLIKYYGNNPHAERKYVMKLNPEIVEKVLNDYYNNGNVFDSDVLNIYRGGWEKSALMDSSPRSHIWELITEHMENNNIVESDDEDESDDDSDEDDDESDDDSDGYESDDDDDDENNK